MEKLKWFQMNLDARVTYLNEQLDKLHQPKLTPEDKKEVTEIITTILTWENEND